MALLLGVDTGGTYTDAVLMQDEEQVIASAKSLTTRADLSVGISNAIKSVLDQAKADPSDIALASMSTTLATNALVEGQGGRVCLVLIGFGEKDIARQGLDVALKDDPVIIIAGGHNHAGSEVATLDIDRLRSELENLSGTISGFAVASQFATRNPEHEIKARDLIRETTSAPVSCSHELSAKLGGPKRAMTAVLNARLIGMIDHLIAATETLLIGLDINAPLMVVRGDGALISAAQAREKPIETILSGPAASLVGARWLTDEQDALVSDIGGTTTDIALLRDGRPKIDPDGAEVGGLRTMVEAVAMRTFGLGGDSQVHMSKDGLSAGLILGPKRVMPISLLAMTHADLVIPHLENALNDERASAEMGQFVMPVERDDLSRAGLSPREEKLLDRITGVMVLSDVLQSALERDALERLIARGLVMRSGITPSDASHVLGGLDAWNTDAAKFALDLFAKQRTGAGVRLAATGAKLAQMIVDQLTQQTSENLLEVAFSEDDGIAGNPKDLARHMLTQTGLGHHKGIVQLHAGLNVPLIGLGASARAYYGAVGDRVSTRTLLPELGGVANAIGAVVGQITMRKAAEITSAGEGAYNVHLNEAAPQVFADRAAAFELVEHSLSEAVRNAAMDAGAQDVRVRVSHDIQEATVENKKVFVSAMIRATATGRPRIT